MQLFYCHFYYYIHFCLQFKDKTVNKTVKEVGRSKLHIINICYLKTWSASDGILQWMQKQNKQIWIRCYMGFSSNCKKQMHKYCWDYEAGKALKKMVKTPSESEDFISPIRCLPYMQWLLFVGMKHTAIEWESIIKFPQEKKAIP